MAITGDDQFLFRGWQFGDGTSFDVVSVSGLGGPQIDRSSLPRVQGHGFVVSRADVMRERLVTFDVQIAGSSRAALQTNLDVVAAAMTPAATNIDEPLVFQILGTAKRINCRPNRWDWSWTVASDIGLLVPTATVQFAATADPRVYLDGTTSTVLA